MHILKIGTALDSYFKDHNGQYPLDLRSLVPNDLLELPVCPLHGGYSGGYSRTVSAKGFELSCVCLKRAHFSRQCRMLYRGLNGQGRMESK